ncbi:peptidoglycan-binding protein [Oculatella sp. FACHB-28]|uniref:GH25 family lysozyme n=1 Tax=Oculatella sp. FACHB-28 TaxID=2692845 RepID=UPI00168291AE|nr:GH25 family lysozyme [Oculatella sp. FACHB-28]MBD2056975.1 peptidoglycan-binding protein [Oculatella sp. FACHB-28]
MSVPGIDVSDHQLLVDWSTVASQGIKFALIKATEGKSFRASTFKDKWRDAKSADILRGAYHFFRPTRTGEEQADNFLQALDSTGGLEVNDLSPVLDIEVKDGVSSDVIRERCLIWLAKVEAETGRKAIIYTGASYGDTNLSVNAQFADYPLWVAHYTRGKPWVPGRWKTCAIWQYTDKGKVKGINGNVDLNWFNGSTDALKAFATGDYSQIRSSSLFDNLINRGDTGEVVRQVQQLLIMKGYDVGPSGTDGDFGANTESAVTRFQGDNNLPITGIVDPATFEKLNQ